MIEGSWAERLAPFIGRDRLEIGSGAYPTPGWTTLDMSPDFNPDYLHDLHDLPLPFGDGSMDTILASHVLEHVEQHALAPLVTDLARILRPGGHLIAIVPHGEHSSSWENPLHRQRFTERTWMYFDRRLYDPRSGEHYCGTGANQRVKMAAWSVAYLSVTPSDEWKDKPAREIDAARKTHRDVVAEMQVVLRREP